MLRFCEKWLPGHIGLVMEHLGPPAIAQTCCKAWVFAETQYQPLTHHAVKIRPILTDDRPLASPPPQPPWFHPAIDVLCVNLPWYDVFFKGGGSGYVRRPRHGAGRDQADREWDPDPPRDLHAFGGRRDDLDPPRGASAYSEIVRALRPFAARAETVAVRPSLVTGIVAAYDFFPYADDAVFPRLRTVLVTAQRLEWDDSGRLPPRGAPRPKWSVRLLDAFAPDLARQVHAEFGRLDPARSARLVRHSTALTEKGEAVWNAERTDEDAGTGRRQDELSRSDAVHLWLRAAQFLRHEFDTLEDGDRIYHNSYCWYWNRKDEKLDADIGKVMSTGGLPLLEPVAMVHKAPLV